MILPKVSLSDGWTGRRVGVFGGRRVSVGPVVDDDVDDGVGGGWRRAVLVCVLIRCARRKGRTMIEMTCASEIRSPNGWRLCAAKTLLTDG